MNYDFVLTSRYDKTAYQALAEASWQLFRKPSLQTRAYPILVALAALVIFSMIFSRNKYGPAALAGGVIFCVFVLAAIPLSGLSAKRKMCSNAIKDASSRDEFPADIQFVFAKDTILSTVKENTSVVYYSQVDGFAALGEWRFLFFGQAAYIFHKSSFKDEEDLKRFDRFVEEKCGKPPLTLKGEGPKR